ncbi:ATP-dependent DNA ligase [Aquihabitans sp. McL0605]|uniref:ATP-dependent DNA ligase n=1 Tax=Aquihabitans sp. McL0605 TaxID=3415671 RepID=UPI003CF5D1E0
MLFVEVVATSAQVAGVSGRSDKRDALAALLRRLEPQEIEPAVGFLTGEPRQGRIGVGWRTIASAEQPPAAEPSLTIDEIDEVLTVLAGTAGTGSAGRKQELLGAVLARATAEESAFLFQLVGGGLRQGALAGVMTDAVATASEIPATVVRRAIMLGGRLDTVARIALTEDRAAVEAVALEVGRPVQPMLASTAASVTEALAELGESAVEWKLDGIRIQVHRAGDEVTIYTRNLNDITERLPQVADLVRTFPGSSFVLDGEALVVDPASGRPVAFQDSASGIRSDEGAGTVEAAAGSVQPFFFDLVHLDGRDLIDEPVSVRRPLLADLTGASCIPGTVTDQADAGEAVLASALASGHEGVVVKAIGSPYLAGRRGKAWRKVKPVHTLDLVVLAVEWGHGRRTGWLSNLHLGARAVDGSPATTRDGFVMVGKTFKGLTDDLLRWQTERFLALAEREDQWSGPQTGVVWVQPEQVVEIALDGVQRSTRYPGGVALRFARVVRYRDDKPPEEADPITTVQAMRAG